MKVEKEKREKEKELIDSSVLPLLFCNLYREKIAGPTTIISLSTRMSQRHESKRQNSSRSTVGMA